MVWELFSHQHRRAGQNWKEKMLNPSLAWVGLQPAESVLAKERSNTTATWDFHLKRLVPNKKSNNNNNSNKKNHVFDLPSSSRCLIRKERMLGWVCHQGTKLCSEWNTNAGSRRAGTNGFITHAVRALDRNALVTCNSEIVIVLLVATLGNPCDSAFKKVK